MKTIDSSKHMAAGDDENTVDSSNSIKEQSQKIEQAGVEETPAGETLEEEKTYPEPKKKTPEEMMENPEEVSDQHEEGESEEEAKDDVKDPLSVEDNDERLESVKNANADGDVDIKKDGDKKLSAKVVKGIIGWIVIHSDGTRVGPFDSEADAKKAANEPQK